MSDIRTENWDEHRPGSRRMTLAQLLIFGMLLGFSMTLGYFWYEHTTHPAYAGHIINNARQLYLAAFFMAADGQASGEEALGFPGDLRDAKSPKAKVTTVSGYINRLKEYDYLKESDVVKVCSAPGIEPWNPAKPFDGDKNFPYKIYAITKEDGAANILYATRNFTYNQALDANRDPYRSTGFVVMRKGGDGAALRPHQVSQLQVIGLLPGRTDYTQDPHEMPTDTLLQK